eukprot:UN27393
MTKKEKERMEKEEKEGAIYYKYFYESLKSKCKLKETECANILKELYKMAPEGKKSDKKSQNTEACGVCYCEFENDAVKMKTCGHTTCCDSCFVQYVKIRIKDDDVMPWIPCPEEDCRGNIDVTQIIQHCDVETLNKLIHLLCSKNLIRNSRWVGCKTDKCECGFLVPDDYKGKMKCQICGTKQKVSHDVLEDDSMKELLK